MKAGEGVLVVPDGGWGWVVLIAAFLSNVLVQGVMKSLGLILVEIMDVFSVSTTQVAVIPSLVYFLYCSLAPMASSLCTRFSCRSVTGIGALFAVIGIIVSSCTDSIYILYLSLGVSYGVGAGLMYTSGFLMVSMYFDKFRGLANGLCVAGNALGGVFMPFIVSFLIQVYGYHGAMFILGGLLLNCFVPPLVFHPVDRHMKTVLSDPNDAKEEPNAIALPPKAALVTNGLDQSDSQSDESFQESTPCSETAEDYWADSGYNTVTQNNQETVVQAPPKKPAMPLSRESTFMNEAFYRKPSIKGNQSHISSQSNLNDIPEGSLPVETESFITKPVFLPLHYYRQNPSTSAVILGSNGSFKEEYNYLQSLSAIHIHFDPKVSDSNKYKDTKYDTNYKCEALRKNVSAADGMALLDSDHRHTNRRSRKRLSSTRSFIDSIASSVSSVRMSNTFLGSSVNMIEDQAKAEVEAIKKKHRTSTFTESEENDLAATIDLKIDDNLRKDIDGDESKSNQKAFDWAIIKNTKCILILISLVTTSIGYSNFLTFLPSYTQLELHMGTVETNLLLAIIAGTDLAGRVIGAIASKTVQWQKIFLYIFSLTFSGVGMFILVCLDNLLPMALFSGVFGLLSGIYVGATPAMLGEELGAENVKYSYPISLLLQGLANLAGPLLCSALVGHTQTYVTLFTILGVVLITGGLIFVVYPLAVKFEKKKIDNKSFEA